MERPTERLSNTGPEYYSDIFLQHETRRPVASVQTCQLRAERMPHSVYLERPELSSSTLKALDREGPEYVAAMQSSPHDGESRALVFGSAVHAYLDGTFLNQFDVAPESYKTAESQKFVDFQAEQTKTILTVRENQDVLACGSSLRKALGTFLGGRKTWTEPSIFWEQETASHKVPCRCRPDMLVDDLAGGVVYLEIKTAASTGLHAWRSSCWQYGYWLQQAHYEAGILAAGAKAVRTIFVVVRKSYPFDVRFYEFSGDDRINAQLRWMALVEDYAARCRSMSWTTDSVRNPTSVALGITYDMQLEVE